MNDVETIERRLRRTFQVIAEQPIGITHAELGESGSPRRPRRYLRVVMGAVAVAVVIALVSLGIAFGPRSGSGGKTTPASEPAQALRAVLVPGHPVSQQGLQQVARVMRKRLHALGDNRTTITLKDGSIEASNITLAEVHEVETVGALFVRPVLCGAPSYSPPAGASVPTTPPPLLVCGAQYQTTASNLDFTPQSSGAYRYNHIPPDPTFSSYTTTPPSGDDPSRTVLLPNDPIAGGGYYPRWVLGPAELNGNAIASAHAEYSHALAEWVIDITFKPAAIAPWDAVARKNFHAYIALDFDGQVLSAPLIQPDKTTFSSFGGHLQVAGNFGASEARSLVAALGAGPLPVPMNLASLTYVPK